MLNYFLRTDSRVTWLSCQQVAFMKWWYIPLWCVPLGGWGASIFCACGKAKNLFDYWTSTIRKSKARDYWRTISNILSILCWQRPSLTRYTKPIVLSDSMRAFATICLFDPSMNGLKSTTFTMSWSFPMFWQPGGMRSLEHLLRCLVLW